MIAEPLRFNGVRIDELPKADLSQILVATHREFHRAGRFDQDQMADAYDNAFHQLSAEIAGRRVH